MLYRTTLLAMVLFLSVLSCNKEDRREVTMTDYLRDKIEHQMEVEVLVIKKGNEIEYTYKDPADSDSVSFHILTKDLNNDSSVRHYLDTARLINRKTYKTNDQSWEVKKYLVNREGGSHGDHYHLYLNDDLGLIAVQSQDSWRYIVFDYENGQISQYLIKDTLDFFNPWIH